MIRTNSAKSSFRPRSCLFNFDFDNIVSEIPDYTSYLSREQLDESSETLAKQHPDRVHLLKIGKTKNGNVIQALKIGRGKHNALIYGFPNPEEPVGGLLVEYLSNALVKFEELEQLDYTWYIIKCIDPDGASLTQGYLKGPYTPHNFSLNYYRTPDFATGELAFPFRYGDLLDANRPTAETRALMQLMDGKSFSFLSSLHNMKFGGITYEVSEPCPLLYVPLQEVAKENGIYLRKRAGLMFAPGVQFAKYMTPATNYIEMKAAGKSPLQQVYGGYVLEYARLTNPHVFMMIPECCTWYDPRCLDDNSSSSTLSELRASAFSKMKQTNQLITRTYHKIADLLIPSPLQEMMKTVVDEIENPKINVMDPDVEPATREMERIVSIGQKVDTEGRTDTYRMFHVGAAIRLVDYQVAKTGRPQGLQNAREELDRCLEEYNKVLTTEYQVKHHSLRNLTAMNVASILLAAEYAASGTRWRRTWSMR